MPKKEYFTVHAGRAIYYDGKPCVSIEREGDTLPCAADELTHIIAALLNRLGRRTIATTYLEDGRVCSLSCLDRGK